MSLIGLLIIILVIGFIAWLINYLPIPAPFKTIAIVVLVIICIIWLLSMLGGFGSFTLGHVRR